MHVMVMLLPEDSSEKNLLDLKYYFYISVDRTLDVENFFDLKLTWEINIRHRHRIWLELIFCKN